MSFKYNMLHSPETSREGVAGATKTAMITKRKTFTNIVTTLKVSSEMMRTKMYWQIVCHYILRSSAQCFEIYFTCGKDISCSTTSWLCSKCLTHAKIHSRNQLQVYVRKMLSLREKVRLCHQRKFVIYVEFGREYLSLKFTLDSCCRTSRYLRASCFPVYL